MEDISGDGEEALSDVVLDARTGFLSLLRPLDFERRTGYKFNVTASIYLKSLPGEKLFDSSFLPPPSVSIFQTLTIHVLNRNDESPVIKGDSDNPEYHYHVKVSEALEPGSFVLQVKAYDPDGDVVSFTFPESHPCSSLFELNAVTGELKTRGSLDRESDASHDIPIYVFDDDHTHMTIAKVLITVDDVNEFPPEFSIKNHSLKIPEDVPSGSIVYRLIAFDQDLWPPPDQTVGLKYSFLTSNPNDGLFLLHPTTGHISTSAPLDRESQSLYEFTVEASDGLYSTSCNLTIELLDVNDNPPVFDRKVYAAVLDVTGSSTSEGLKEKEVIIVRATDADPNDSIYYTLNSSSLVKSDSLFFRINSSSGIITADIPALVQSQRFRNKNNPSALSTSSTFSFHVLAMDVGSSYTVHSSSAEVRITFTHSIEPTAPKLRQYPLIIELDGHRNDFKVGSQVGSIEFDSLGHSSKVLISVHDSESSYRCSDYLTIDSSTGAVLVKRVIQRNFLECYLEVEGSEDGEVGGPSTSSLLQIFFRKGISPDLKARKANAFSIQVEVSEATQVGSQIVNLIKRSKMPTLESGKYKFSLSYSSLDSSYFDLEPNSGIINLAKRLDYEILPPSLELVAVATEKSNPFDSPVYFNIIITLLNVNDDPPKFSQQHFKAFVHEGQGRGTFVAPLFALDGDALKPLLTFQDSLEDKSAIQVNPWIKYQITDGNVDDAFSLDSYTGVIRTNMVLDREIRNHYLLSVMATDLSQSQSLFNTSSGLIDTSSRRHSAECLVEIYVIDIDDNLPVFPPHQEVRVRESSPVGSIITTLTANDVDQFPLITYRQQKSLSGPQIPFDIDMFSGKLIVLAPLKGESSHVMKILASDSLHTIETEMRIQVGDVLSHPPIIVNPFQFIQVDPSSNKCFKAGGINCQVGRVEYINKNSGSLKVLFRLGSDPSGSFYVDSTTGVLFNNRSLKLKSNKLFSVSILAGYSLNGDRYLNGLRSRSYFMINILRSDYSEDPQHNILLHSKISSIHDHHNNDISDHHFSSHRHNLSEGDASRFQFDHIPHGPYGFPKRDAFDRKSTFESKPWYSRKETFLWFLVLLIALLLIPVALFVYRRLHHRVSALKTVKKKMDWNDLHFLNRRSATSAGTGPGSQATSQNGVATNEMNVPVPGSDNHHLSSHVPVIVPTTIYSSNDLKISNHDTRHRDNPLGHQPVITNHYQWDCLYNPPPHIWLSTPTANSTCSPVYPKVSPIRDTHSSRGVTRTPSEYEFRPIDLPPES